MYGSTKTKEGTAMRADGKVPILAGECVESNELISLEMAKDANGNPIDTRAILSFRQSNGGIFSHTFWDSDKDWGIEQCNTEMLHVCTKIVTKEEYEAIVSEHGDGTFKGWISAVATHIIPKSQGKTYSLKIIFRENTNNGNWYANFPKYPNFIAEDGAPYSFRTNPDYDIYSIPSATKVDESPKGDATAATEVAF